MCIYPETHRALSALRDVDARPSQHEGHQLQLSIRYCLTLRKVSQPQVVQIVGRLLKYNGSS